MGEQTVSTSRDIEVSPAEVFAFLTDPANHVRMDGSGSVRNARSNRRLTGVGDTFAMQMRRNGLPYPIVNTVVEYEPDRRLAWRHAFRHRWRYELEPLDGGSATRVTETFDRGPAPFGFLYPMLFGFPEAYREMMERTLERLERLLTDTPA